MTQSEHSTLRNLAAIWRSRSERDNDLARSLGKCLDSVQHMANAITLAKLATELDAVIRTMDVEEFSVSGAAGRDSA